MLCLGTAENMCVLGRSFGIRCVLARDLTDTMYNPKMSPFVSHDEGTGLVAQHNVLSLDNGAKLHI